MQCSNILRGVPTNSQLTLTLLRIGEAHNTPLPPVPTSGPADPDRFESGYIAPADIPLAVSDIEKQHAINSLTNTEKAHTDNKSNENPEPKHKRLSKFTRFFKGNTRAVVETKLSAVDHIRAALGSDKAKSHLGVLSKEKDLIYAGPSDFKARYKGKQGWLYITEDSNPALSFTTAEPRPDGSHTDEEPLLTVPVEDIKVLKRATAFVSNVGEIAANWAEDKKLLGSIEIEDLAGKDWRFTALPERDELFNRLVALGSQKWENL